MKSKSDAAQRKQAERERYREAGLVMLTVPVHPADRPAARRYIERLNRRRIRA
jgi:hypothetical protein